MTYKEETIQIAQERAENIKNEFVKEVERLLNSGAVDSENHNRGLLFSVALENINTFIFKKDKEYKNLKYF